MRGTPAQLAAYAGKSERTIHRYLASGKWPHKRLAGGLVEVDDSLLIGPGDEQESVLLATLSRIEQKLDALSATVGTLGQPQETSDAVTRSAARPIPTRRATEEEPGGELAPGLYAWRDYCKEKGYSETTVGRHIKAGDVPVLEGRWKRGHAIITQAITDEGKAAIDRLYTST